MKNFRNFSKRGKIRHSVSKFKRGFFSFLSGLPLSRQNKSRLFQTKLQTKYETNAQLFIQNLRVTKFWTRFSNWLKSTQNAEHQVSCDYRSDALLDAQPTALKHWRRTYSLMTTVQDHLHLPSSICPYPQGGKRNRMLANQHCQSTEGFPMIWHDKLYHVQPKVDR